MRAARSSPGGRARPTRWGWHRLDPDAARHVVARAGVTAGDLVVDLGAGHGAITAALVDAGAHVVAVELHPERIEALRRRFAGAPVTVVAGDVTRLRLPRRGYRVVANPPWAVAETVRRTLLRSPPLQRADLVLPRWLVRRWAERSPRIEVGCSLRAEAFTPPAPAGVAVAVVHGTAARRGVSGR